jgi:HEAT repeat protein
MKRSAIFLILFLYAPHPTYGVDAGSIKENLQSSFSTYVSYIDKGTADQKKIALLRIAGYLRYSEYRLDPAPLNKVFAALSDRDPAIREAAAACLKLVGRYSKGCCREETDIVPRLVAALDDPSPRVRDEAAKALGYYKDRRATIALTKRLEDADLMVRLNAAYALGKIPGTGAALPLLELLEGGSPEWRDRLVEQEAIDAFRKVGGRISFTHRDRLVRVLLEKAGDRYLRAHAIRALGRFRIEEARGILEEALKDPDDKVRKYAAAALAGLKGGRDLALDLEPFEKALKDPVHGERTKAVRALGALRNKSAVGPLITATTDESYLVRMEAAKALAKYDDERVFSTLAGLLGDRNGSVRSETLKVFKPLAKRTAQGRIYNKKKRLTLYMHPVAVTSLLGVLEQGDTRTKRDVLGLLAIFDDERVEVTLKRYIDDPLPAIRSKALFALGTREADNIGVVLEMLVNDKDPQVRQSAASTLRHFEDKRARDALINVVENTGEEWYVRSAALNSIWRYRDPEVSTLIARMIGDKTEKIRRDAISGVQRWPKRFRGDEGVREALIRRLSTDELGMPIPAMRALSRIGYKEAVEPMIRVLNGGLNTGNKKADTAVQMEAAYNLSLLGDKRGVRFLIDRLGDREEDFSLRLAAANTLGRTRDPAAIEPLESFLEESFSFAYKKRIKEAIDRLKSAKSRGTSGRPGR